jgi:arylsulfatase A-like enzyme
MPNTPNPVRNVLYIMCDQLRRDYLSCYGHPHLHTPNIDRLAAAGVRFSRAYTQGTICGPSRMSAYTGRYVSSHQVAWNAVPLPLEELTIGDYLRPHGIRTALVGKTHATPNLDALQRLAIDPLGDQASVLNEVGFEPFFRHDGIFPDDPLFDDKRESAHYTHHLRDLGFTGRNPWHDWANAAAGEQGEILSGWKLRNGAAFGDRLHHRPRPRLHCRAGRATVVPAPVVHQAPLALHRPGALPRAVWRRTGDRAGACSAGRGQ